MIESASLQQSHRELIDRSASAAGASLSTRVLESSATSRLEINPNSPFHYFLGGFGIDPRRAEIKVLQDEWGKVSCAQVQQVLNLCGQNLNVEILKSVESIFFTTYKDEFDSGYRRVLEQARNQPANLSILDEVFLLTYRDCPVAFVWLLGRGKGQEDADLIYYPLFDPLSSDLLGAEISNSIFSNDTFEYDLRQFLSAYFGLENQNSIRSSLRNLDGKPLSLFSSSETSDIFFPEQTSPSQLTRFIGSYWCTHDTASVLLEKLVQLIQEGEISPAAQPVTDIGSGAGVLTRALLLLGFKNLKAYDITLLKALNTAYNIRDFDRYIDGVSCLTMPQQALYLGIPQLLIWSAPNLGRPTFGDSIGLNAHLDQNANLDLSTFQSVLQCAANSSVPATRFLIRAGFNSDDGSILSIGDWSNIFSNAGWSISRQFSADSRALGEIFLLERRN